VAYLQCPWCLSPQLVSDDAATYQCQTCYAEVRFFTCPRCALRQSVNGKWSAFTCSRCQAKVDLPRRWGYASATKARQVEGAGQPWPKF
jgi:hypothetical protein